MPGRVASRERCVLTHDGHLFSDSIDAILVVDDRRIVEQRTHEELLAAGGRDADR